MKYTRGEVSLLLLLGGTHCHKKLLRPKL